MLRWLKKKCTGKQSKRLRTSSISDFSRNHDYTSHPDTNVYDEIDDSQTDLAYAVTSLVDIIDADSFNEVCPLCRQLRNGANCQCMDDVTSPFKIRNDLGDDDDFSWLEYDIKSASQSSLQRSRSDNSKRSGNMRQYVMGLRKEATSTDDGSSSGFYETDDSCSDDVVLPKAGRPSLGQRMDHSCPKSPLSAPKMGCKVIKRTQSAINTRKPHVLHKSKSDHLNSCRIKTVKSNASLQDRPRVLNTTLKKTTDDSTGDDAFDHTYANVCIDINNLEIPKLRKSSYTSRSHGQNRLLNDLMRMNYDKQTFSGVRR